MSFKYDNNDYNDLPEKRIEISIPSALHEEKEEKDFLKF